MRKLRAVAAIAALAAVALLVPATAQAESVDTSISIDAQRANSWGG